MEKKKMAGSHFFKIICNYVIEDRRLELPKKFVRLFVEELGKAGVIEDPTGKIWPVELRRTKSEIYFQSGWQEFMDYFSISVGHFLIFRYEGDSHFHVSICDTTTCEIEYPYRHGEDVDVSVSEGLSMENMDILFQSADNARTAANRTRPSCRHHDFASKRRFEDYQEARGSGKRNKSDGFEKNTSKRWVYNFRRHPELPIVISDDESDYDEGYQNPGDSAKHDVTENIEQNRQVINSDTECDEVSPVSTQHRSASHKRKCKIPKKASCAARKVDVFGTKSAMRVMEEAKAFKSDFPTCIIIMKQSYSNKGSPVHVPGAFARKFLIKAGDNLVTLHDSTGRKWRVGYRFRKVGRRRAELYKGWFQFVLENHLKVGDACVFELVDIDKLEMKVNIFRACMPFGKRHPASSEENRRIPGESAEHNDFEDIESDGGRTMPTQTKSQRAMGVIKEARAFKSDFPICAIIMEPSYILKGRTVHVPFKFARDFLPMAGDKFVTLKDSAGKKWRVGYSTNPSAHKACLYHGWHEFVLGNHLMTGDACVFELVDIDNLEMKMELDDDRIDFGESNTLGTNARYKRKVFEGFTESEDDLESMVNSKLQRSSSERSKPMVEKRSKDRISELPDTLIHHILSFLNIGHVLQTSLLSRRWRYLWVSLPSLRISDHSIDRMDWNVEDPFEALNRYIIFVDRLLLLRDSSSDIQTLELRWENVGNFKSGLGFKYDVSRHVATWIMAAVKHNVQELNLTLFLREMIKLPGCLLTCKSLTKLGVRGFGSELTSFGLPDVAVYNFPRLRYLELKGVSLEDENLTSKFFSSCPVLESLVLADCNISFNFSSLSLKHFQLDNCESIDYYNNDINVKLSAPNLTSLVCKDYMSQDYSLENLSSLVTADIGMKMSGGYRLEETPKAISELATDVKQLYSARMVELIRAVCNVTDLTLSSPGFLEVVSGSLNSLGDTCFQFSNLRCLKVETWVSSNCMNAIAYLVRTSPNIESLCLTIEQTELTANNTGGDWIVGSPFPCLHYLKFVQIQGMQGCFNELKFLQILLDKAIILEKVELFCCKRDSPDRAKQMMQFKDMLLAFRTTSSSVSISMKL